MTNHVVAQLAVACTLLLGCESSVTATLPAGFSRLGVGLSGAPDPQGSGLKVTLERVLAHSSRSGWISISQQPVEVDATAEGLRLGTVDLPSGPITQLRLYFGEQGQRTLTLPDGEELEMELAPGIQAGIKVPGPFELLACHRTEIALAFDGAKSIWNDPDENDWVLRPVVRARAVTTNIEGCDELSTVAPSGKAASAALPEGVPGTACTRGNQCLSGVCAASACAPGGPSTPCSAGPQCASGTCAAGECTAGNARGAGGACSAPSDCLSNSCEDGRCAQGCNGSACAAAKDCVAGVSCVNSSCQSIGGN